MNFTREEVQQVLKSLIMSIGDVKECQENTPDIFLETAQIFKEQIKRHNDAIDLLQSKMAEKDDVEPVRFNEEAIDEYIADYYMVGEDEFGRDACYEPTERERILIKDALMGMLSDDEITHPAPKPMPYLMNGTRFKAYLTDHGCVIDGLPRSLSGQWVALVAAENDCHLDAPKPMTDFAIRGKLSTLKCWHRLTGDDAQDLIEFVQDERMGRDADSF